jgi:hypothetical protein
VPRRKPCSACAELRAAWRAAKTDGCSAVPDFGFTSCCNNHDRDYALHVDHRGKPTTRLRSDLRLLSCMLHDKRRPLLRRLLVSPVFFLGVRLFGGKFW